MQTALDLEFVPQMAAVRTARDATAVVVPSLSAERQDEPVEHLLEADRMKVKVLGGIGRVKALIGHPSMLMAAARTPFTRRVLTIRAVT